MIDIGTAVKKRLRSCRRYWTYAVLKKKTSMDGWREKHIFSFRSLREIINYGTGVSDVGIFKSEIIVL